MRTVWKYEIPVSEHVELWAPEGMEIVHAAPFMVQMPQVLVIWCLVETENPQALHRLAVHGTGHPVGDGEEYVASVQVPPFVWHVFQVER